MEARRYQLRLADYLMERNGIVYLPTGAGKTYIAILVIKRFSQALTKTIAEGGKRTIFMCNTVDVAIQQCIEIRKCTNLHVGVYTGDRNVDAWNRNRWNEELNKNQILVGTAQIFVDMLAQNFLKVTDLNLVIVDECHHATRNHPMHVFLSLFQHEEKVQLPRVIGLTGVLVKGNKLSIENLEKELNCLESTFRGNIITVDSAEAYDNVMLYATQPIENILTYTPQNDNLHILDKITNLITNWTKVIEAFDLCTESVKKSKSLMILQQPSAKKMVKSRLQDIIYHLKDFGLYLGALAVMSIIVEIELKKRQAVTIASRNLYRYVIKCLEYLRHLLLTEMKSTLCDNDKEVSKPIKDELCDNKTIIENYSSSKLRSLFNYMSTIFANKNTEDISCLIFVQRRYTAKCVYYAINNYLKNQPNLRKIIKPQFTVGRNNMLCNDVFLENKWNSKAVEQFRRKDCNLIVCSNVLEEGIDFPSCNYVFVLDELQTFNSYIQSKGRARSPQSNYTIFVNKIDTMKICKRIQFYQSAHMHIKTYLLSRTLQREDPTTENINEQFRELIPTFSSPSGARLLPQSALSLLHRYCCNLPQDAFGIASPIFYKIVEKPDNFTVGVKLPIQCPIKDSIISDVMENIRDAKISAAYKACIRLYKCGELNERFLPVTNTECLNKVSGELFSYWDKHKDNVTRKIPGKTFSRLHNSKCPEEFYDALPRMGENCYAYKILFYTDFDINPYNDYIVKNLNKTGTYALLIRKHLPLLAEMPLFMSQGKIRVQIASMPVICKLNNVNDIKRLENFHTMLFRDLLKCWKNFFVIDRRQRENSYFIVPMNDKHSIDWELVDKFQNLKSINNYTVGKDVYNPDNYIDKVISKSYSMSSNEYYIVTKIRHDLNPLSPFESSNYENYVQFFQSRYNLIIKNYQQFLLEVRPITQRRNFFINAIGKSSVIKKDTHKMILIPELCKNYHYPGHMWLKAIFLPSVLHRVYFMLHAESLRRRINKYLVPENEFSNYKPKPLIIDMSLRRAVDNEGNAIDTSDEKPSTFLTPLMPINKEISTIQSMNPIEMNNMEPRDISRNLDSLFTIDIDYYNRYIDMLTSCDEDINLSSENFYNFSQLEMPLMTTTKNNSINNTKQINKTTKPITRNAALFADIELFMLKDKSKEEKYRIDILTRSFQMNDSLKSAEQYEILAAITTAFVNDVFDMERYEVLGDAFLKLTVSLYLVNRYPHFHEGYLTAIKSRMVSNRNLLYCMLETDICERLCATQLILSINWIPPLAALPINLIELLQANISHISCIPPSEFFNLELNETEIEDGKCNEMKLSGFKERIHRYNPEKRDSLEEFNDMYSYIYKREYRDKVAADCLEALLGVCVKNYGIYRSFRMLEFFKIIKNISNLPLQNLLDLKLSSHQLRTNISSNDIDKFLINSNFLEKNLGYTFRDKAYLLQAITHPSYPTNRITGCYQELEFIGDAILDMLITCYIFERYQNKTPGHMTDMRMALVNNITLACICVRHRFHLFLLYENTELSETIKRFADFQQKQGYRVSNQVLFLSSEDQTTSFLDDHKKLSENDNTNKISSPNSKQNISNFAVNIDVPKALGDMVEALIAAVYLDCRDLITTWKVIYGLLNRELDEFANNVPLDPVRELNENRRASATFSNADVQDGVTIITCQFNYLNTWKEVTGLGKNAAQAKKAAAKAALQFLMKQTN